MIVGGNIVFFLIPQGFFQFNLPLLTLLLKQLSLMLYSFIFFCDFYHHLLILSARELNLLLQLEKLCGEFISFHNERIELILQIFDISFSFRQFCLYFFIVFLDSNSLIMNCIVFCLSRIDFSRIYLD